MGIDVLKFGPDIKLRHAAEILAYNNTPTLTNVFCSFYDYAGAGYKATYTQTIIRKEPILLSLELDDEVFLNGYWKILIIPSKEVPEGEVWSGNKIMESI